MFTLDRLEGVTEELEERGMNPQTGRFQKGHKFGRPKGRRNKLTQEMLDRMAEIDLKPDEVLMSIYQDPEAPLDLRFKAAAKMVDIVYPKAASVEIKMDDEDTVTEEMMDAKIADFLSQTLGVDITQPDEETEEE